MAILRILTSTLLVLDALLLFIFFFSLFNAWAMRPDIGGRKARRRAERKVVTIRDIVFRDRWRGIAQMVKREDTESLKLAIIEADKVADDALKQLGLTGEHMADRLEQLSEEDLKSLGRLWRAHRLRNEIVHTPGFELPPQQARNALDAYEAFLTEIGVLEPRR